MTQHVLAGMVATLVLGAGVCAAEPPRAEHPRPDMMRGAWMTLNGEWEFAETDDDKAEFLGEEVLGGGGSGEVGAGFLDVNGHVFERVEVALAGDEDTFGGRLPADEAQQALAQGFESGTGACAEQEGRVGILLPMGVHGS